MCSYVVETGTQTLDLNVWPVTARTVLEQKIKHGCPSSEKAACPSSWPPQAASTRCPPTLLRAIFFTQPPIQMLIPSSQACLEMFYQLPDSPLAQAHGHMKLTFTNQSFVHLSIDSTGNVWQALATHLLWWQHLLDQSFILCLQRDIHISALLPAVTVRAVAAIATSGRKEGHEKQTQFLPSINHHFRSIPPSCQALANGTFAFFVY